MKIFLGLLPMELLKTMFNLAEDSAVEQFTFLDSEFFSLYVQGRGERPAHLLYEISYIVINASGISSYTYYFQDLVFGGKVLEEKQSFGMFEALKSLKNDNYELIIVSHKTKYPYSGKKYDLHKAASNWLEVNKFFDPNGLAMKKENVYFEITKEDKISRIEQLDISFYIDDLQSILSLIKPSIKRILYSPKFKEKIDKDFYLLENWENLK